MAEFLSKVPGEPLLYISDAAVFYLRITDRRTGKDTSVSLHTKIKKEAVGARRDYWNAKTASKLGLALNPTRQRRAVLEILDAYTKAGHPNEALESKMGSVLVTEQDALPHLRKYFNGMLVEQLKQKVFDLYRKQRRGQIKNKDGARTVDLELATLSAAMTYGISQDLIKANPLEGRRRYHQNSKARHAKDVAPLSSDDVHKTAAIFFEDPRSESIGWFFLWTTASGLRRSEAQGLRMDAVPGQPGYVTETVHEGVTSHQLCVRPSKQKEFDPRSYITLRPDQVTLMGAHREWLKNRFPDGVQWWFPGRPSTVKGDDTPKVRGPIGEDSLTHALDRLFELGKITRKITTHGGRGYYVMQRRSWAVPDSVIAREIHHKGDLGTLIETYGQVPVGWTDHPPRFAWIPSVPAWTVLKKDRSEPTAAVALE